jgi:hypothetical protein
VFFEKNQSLKVNNIKRKLMVPQSKNSSDSETTVEDCINLLAEWQDFYKEIIRTGTIIKNTGLLKVLKKNELTKIWIKQYE